MSTIKTKLIHMYSERNLNLKKKFIYILMSLLISSCIPQKRLEYINNPVNNQNIYQLHKKPENLIKPNDELYIRVSSFDDVAHNFFNDQSNTNNMNYGNDVSVALISYSVNDSGYIYFPIVGHILVKDLTIDEATNKLKNLLSEYFNQPTVLIKFVNKRVTVMGEVSKPGTYVYTSERINIFQALSLAGDITVHGDKRDVFLVRSVNDSIIKTKVDLTKDHILFSANYFLNPDDIIYVRPRRSIKWNVVSVPISLMLSTITTSLLIINYVK